MSQSFKSLREQVRKMPARAQIKVDELCARYAGRSGFDRRLVLKEAIDRVDRALNCDGRCCSGKTVEERLEDA
jgi:hypothetical protein